jgi:hypothetical protein
MWESRNRPKDETALMARAFGEYPSKALIASRRRRLSGARARRSKMSAADVFGCRLPRQRQFGIAPQEEADQEVQTESRITAMPAVA